MKQKRAIAVNDISCFGKCSLTVALPILSAAGIETCPVPTALLSTHTGGFTNFHFRDLTQDVDPIVTHWHDLGLEFDAIYSGYLGSFEQLELVSKIFDMMRSEGTIVMVDPVMADNGVLYKGFSDDFPKGMRKLCEKADIITPNFTEAAFLLGEEYKEGPYTKEYVDSMLKKLAETGAKQIVLTGVHFDKEKLGAASYDSETGEISYAFSEWVSGMYHGTGDTFASVLLSAIMCGFSLGESIQKAVDFVSACVRRTSTDYPYMKYGVNFEAELPGLCKDLGLI